MKPARLSLLLVIVGNGALLAGQEQPRQSTFRSGTEVVTIDVSVHRGKAPVTGLTAQDFEVMDNGVRQSIELQTIDTVPVDVTVVFGNYHATVLGGLLASDLSKIAAWLRHIDRLRVIAYATDVREVVTMSAPARVQQQGVAEVALSRAGAALWRSGPDRKGVDPRNDPSLRGEAVFDAVLLAITRPPELGRRHLVVVFCAPADKGSVLIDGDFLKDLAARSDALLHVQYGWGSGSAAPSAVIGPREFLAGKYTRLALADAAAATGGALHNFSNAMGAFRSIFEDLKQSYVLQYTVTGVSTGGWHTVTVKTPRFPTYDVQARRGYMGR